MIRRVFIEKSKQNEGISDAHCEKLEWELCCVKFYSQATIIFTIVEPLSEQFTLLMVIALRLSFLQRKKDALFN